MIGKEALVSLEILAAKQRQIYNDSCDSGIWETPEVRTAIVLALGELKELEGVKSSQWANGVSCETRLGFEMDGGKVQGVTIRISRNMDKREGRKQPVPAEAFYSIDICRASWDPNASL